MKARLILIGLAILAIGFYGMKFMGEHKKEQPKRKHKPFIPQVSAAVVHYSSLNPEISALGRINSFETVALAPEVSGIVLADKFSLRKGQTFRKNQIVMRIDQRQIRNSLHTFQSDLLNALASFLPELKVEIPDAFDRWNEFFTGLDNKDLPPLPETATQREKLYVSRYNIYKLYYVLKNQHLLLTKHTIRAPFRGTVISSTIDPGSMARAGTPVATVVRTDKLEIEFSVPVIESALIEKGMQVLVYIDIIKDTIPATIDRIAGTVDASMQTVSAFAIIKRPAQLEVKSGMFAQLILKGTTLGHAIRVSRQALHKGNRVYLIKKGKLLEATVSTSYIGLDHAYLSGGLADGDTLITEPVQEAVIGMQMKPSFGSGKK